MVAGHACIRVHKMAIPLIERGHTVHLVAMKVPTFWQHYATYTLCADIEQMISAIKVYDQADVDVFHCHNEPSWFVTACKEASAKPVILDVHDSYLARSTPEEATEALDAGKRHTRVVVEERNNCQLADGLVFPGEHFQKVIASEFKLEQPQLVLPSYVPRRYFKYQAMDWHGGLVYQGKVNLPTELEGHLSGFRYCDYTQLMERCHALNMDLHLYGNRDDKPFREHYQEKAFIHPPHKYGDLLTALGMHDWGLVGNVYPTPEWRVAMPNKLFEYIAAGTPVVAMNAEHCADVVEQMGFGISVANPEELAERWAEHRDCRKRILAARAALSMNAHIWLLEEFYREVIGSHAQRGKRVLERGVSQFAEGAG
jgi:hypothetical protein